MSEEIKLAFDNLNEQVEKAACSFNSLKAELTAKTDIIAELNAENVRLQGVIAEMEKFMRNVYIEDEVECMHRHAILERLS